MKGIAVYLSEPLTEETTDSIRKMRTIGFTSIFTSLHIPEDDPSLYTERLRALGGLARQLEMELVADIAPTSLAALGKTWDDAGTLSEWGVTGLRVDYGVTPKQVADLSRQLMVALNASTVTAEELNAMKAEGLILENVEAWHNYYPRPETGLDRNWFNDKNAWLHGQGICVQAFIPGDGQLRGPLHATLPTLEDHRGQSPFACYLELEASVDRILIGDPSLSENSMRQFAAYREGVIVLRATGQGDDPLLKSVHTNRMDPARDVVRSIESRAYGRPGNGLLEPATLSDRPLGSITIDNLRYGRYAGELQVTKRNLAADERVNVIGRIIEADRALLHQIGPGGRFRFEWVKAQEETK
ncbi:MupG family TIM beta-alpha barrel fold protein [Exiguobacterium antarcticum]|uniref:MupG family TIM beta-alpha barrel fold protein n=1 Tax=Exiguobacterium antarcticum TaxID=132920 RepID=A0ABT6R2I3_9BACL|nr:MupG family TIM beta-alpha barrel fold protein [Exiguobacterium antarcticum]MDI3235149.1 MupG family TIM beta-alpha barrel fold protein [Exiguobacterium antarcticum]